MNEAKNKVEAFLNDLGIEQYWHRKTLSYLLKEEGSIDEFMSGFYDGEYIPSMMAYQKHKREQNRLSVEQFKELSTTNEKEALEKVFQEAISDEMLNTMRNNGMSAIEAHKMLLQHPRESFISIVRSNGSITQWEDYNDDFLINR